MCCGSSPMDDKDWRAEDDHRTLERAAEIKQDQARMAGVAKHHATKKKSLAAIGRSIGSSKRMSGKR
jgi:hypothetical protein